jgi:branched-chain amino acid aminotransferase
VPGVSIVEKTLYPQDLLDADEVFITSTTRDLLPVVRLEDREVPARGGVRERLNREFARYVAKYVADRQPGATPGD